MEKAVYLSAEDSWGLKTWKESLPQEHYKTSINNYKSFYSELESELKKILMRNKFIVIYDLHSYNYKRNGPSQPPESDNYNPELNLGTGTMNRNRWAPIVEKFIEGVKNYNFMGRSLDIRENVKFRGGNFARWIHQKYPDSICCLSIEFRKFFMNEWTGEPYHDVIEEIKNLLKYTTDGVLKELNSFTSSK
jgi:hypothetical protein